MILNSTFSRPFHRVPPLRGRFPRVLGAKLNSSFLIFIHVFLCTKLIYKYSCSSISTKFACGRTVCKWLKVPYSRYQCSYYWNALSSFRLNFGLLKWKPFNLRSSQRYWHTFWPSKAFRLDIAALYNLEPGSLNFFLSEDHISCYINSSTAGHLT